MEEKPLIVVSDTHLGAVPRSTERAFRGFLGHIGEAASGLLINGDLFDFWFEYRSVMLREHYRVLAALTDVVESGVPVWFVGGNHDWWGGTFLTDEVGMVMLDGPARLHIGGRTLLVAHGDGVGPGDLGYRILKSVLRNGLTTRAFRMLHPDWGNRIARLVSTTEEKMGKNPQIAEARAAKLRKWGIAELQANPELDLVVTGHVHVPLILEVEPGRFYANAGDWINHFTYLSVPAGGPPSLEEWPVDAKAGRVRLPETHGSPPRT